MFFNQEIYWMKSLKSYDILQILHPYFIHPDFNSCFAEVFLPSPSLFSLRQGETGEQREAPQFLFRLGLLRAQQRPKNKAGTLRNSMAWGTTWNN